MSKLWRWTVDRDVPPSNRCRSDTPGREHKFCVHVEDGDLRGWSSRPVHVCSCLCHADCPALLAPPEGMTGTCTCVETRSQRQRAFRSDLSSVYVRPDPTRVEQRWEELRFALVCLAGLAAIAIIIAGLVFATVELPTGWGIVTGVVTVPVSWLLYKLALWHLWALGRTWRAR